MSRLRELQMRRRVLVARCDLQRAELGARLEEVKDSPLSRLAAALLSRAPGGARGGLRPLTLLATVAGIVLLRRPRQLGTILALAGRAAAFGSRAALVLRLIEQLRGARKGKTAPGASS